MNERIKHLIEQAQYYANEQNDKHGVSWIRTYNEKFAELIVRECAQAFEAEVDTWKEMDPYQGSMKRKGTKAIKQHFGVEE